MNDQKMKREVTVVLCTRLRNWTLLPTIQRQRAPMPHCTSYQWLFLYIKVEKWMV